MASDSVAVGRTGICLGQETKMPGRQETCRLTMGGFDDPERLRTAIRELLSIGYTTDQLWLAGQPQKMETHEAMEGPDGPRVGPLPINLREAHGVEGPAVTASWDPVPSAAIGTSELPTHGAWLSPEVLRFLQIQLATGAIVLVARARSSEQHIRGTRVLLSKCLGQVQTHEFPVAPGS
jgi:hypothetical protein